MRKIIRGTDPTEKLKNGMTRQDYQNALRQYFTDNYTKIVKLARYKVRNNSEEYGDLINRAFIFLMEEKALIDFNKSPMVYIGFAMGRCILNRLSGSQSKFELGFVSGNEENISGDEDDGLKQGGMGEIQISREVEHTVWRNWAQEERTLPPLYTSALPYLDQFLHSLTEEEHCLVMHLKEGYTFKEIGRLMGYSPMSISKKVQKLRETFKLLLLEKKPRREYPAQLDSRSNP